MNIAPHPPQTSCRRCGICCRKGGPALHLADRELVLAGKIPLKDLFTIRQGEPAYDNIAETQAPAASDIVKIKPEPDNGTICIYYQPEEKGCGIYAHRPWECRTLSCWNPEPLVNKYHLNRLTRPDLLSEIHGLWQLVSDHQKQCDYRKIAKLARCLHQQTNETKAKDQLMTMIRFDQFLREGIVRQSKLAPAMLEFLFGRPLTMTIRMFQLKWVQTESEMTLTAFV